MFRTVGYLRQGETRVYDYELVLPVPLADWDVWDYWERERTHSIAEVMGVRPGWFIDVGMEAGWLSVCHALTVGTDRMCLIEGSAEAWPLARTVWTANLPDPPALTVHALAGRQPAGVPDIVTRGWPQASELVLVQKPSYEYLHDTHQAATIRVDRLPVGLVGGVNVDVEGAEVEVMAGTLGLLERDRPTCWISVHPDLMARDYDTTPGELFDLMARAGYTRTLLATDHEEHWRFDAQ